MRSSAASPVKLRPAPAPEKRRPTSLWPSEHRKRSVYFAFNKPIADEARARFAKVASHVAVSTIHATRYATPCGELKDRLARSPWQIRSGLKERFGRAL